MTLKVCTFLHPPPPPPQERNPRLGPCLRSHPLLAPFAGDLWAVIAAGSAGWGNYRHQADVAHAYQVLHRGGIPDDRIVVIVYDDIANNPANPRPGTLINHPSGADNYAGMPRDYTGSNANADIFLAALSANQSALPPPGPHSSGKFVNSGPNDRIFVFFSDHGAPGLVGFNNQYLYADQLNTVIRGMAANNQFAEMVLYIEACESGSMFLGLLDDDLNVYATTAANERESSWGTYCPGMDPPPPPEYTTCLGDLYSVSWMEDSDANDMTAESLKKQYQKVRLRTSQNYTYSQGSHAERFGALEMDEETASRYLGELNNGRSSERGGQRQVAGAVAAVERGTRVPWTGLVGAMPQREADLVPLIVAAQRGGVGGEEAAVALAGERDCRVAVDTRVSRAVQALLANTNSVFDAIYVMNEPMPAPSGSLALVDDWECLRGMMEAWGSVCGRLDQYGMRHSRAFANLCNLGVAVDDLEAVAGAVCSGDAATHRSEW